MNEPNRLIHASSPYLLQHAYNPVHWHEWGAEALDKAKAENKLILVSIGYSACHWCHVMEQESFEDYEVAEVMNRHFICIKVDREERPDIDQVYMLAVQLMNGNGGWPLNMICLPDQRPVYGGTYFRKTDWINILLNLANLWTNDPQKALAYASRLAEGIQQAEHITGHYPASEFTDEQLSGIVSPWKRNFDMIYGGYSRAPKFPLPNNWQFLLRYGYLMDDEAATMATLLTLEKMALGGIYDQLGGGFARYSVDDRWHVPHFEKMLYDNAQLISLYTEAYQFLREPLYRQVVEESLTWIIRELTSADGLFYSALDADSEGKEGKYYTWTYEEFTTVCGADARILASYFDVTIAGNWEEEKTNILQRKYTDDAFAQHYRLSPEILRGKIESAKEKLLLHRTQRIRPGLDDKCLTAWNAMTIKALVQAAQVFDHSAYYDQACRCMRFILTHLTDDEGGVYRSYKNGKASITGFLDDYAFLIEALIALYESDFDEKWLNEAKALTEETLRRFEDVDSPLLFYTDSGSDALIARKHEIMDNVIPSSNSVMAKNLQKLGLLFDHESYSERARRMLNATLPVMPRYGSAYSNWCIQLLNEIAGINEIAFTGAGLKEVKKAFHSLYIPNKIMLGGTKSNLPLLKDKQSEQTKIYICRNKTCQLPVSTVEEAIKYIK